MVSILAATVCFHIKYLPVEDKDVPITVECSIKGAIVWAISSPLTKWRFWIDIHDMNVSKWGIPVCCLAQTGFAGNGELATHYISWTTEIKYRQTQTCGPGWIWIINASNKKPRIILETLIRNSLFWKYIYKSIFHLSPVCPPPPPQMILINVISIINFGACFFCYNLTTTGGPFLIHFFLSLKHFLLHV